MRCQACGQDGQKDSEQIVQTGLAFISLELHQKHSDIHGSAEGKPLSVMASAKNRAWLTLVRGPAHMPQLSEEDAPGLVNGIDDGLPGRQLGFSVQPRCIWVPSQQTLHNMRLQQSVSFQYPGWTGVASMGFASLEGLAWKTGRRTLYPNSHDHD